VGLAARIGQRVKVWVGRRMDPGMGKQIASITGPAFLEIVLSTLFGMVDMMMVGRISPAAITSIGLTNQPFMLLLAIFSAVNVGTTAMVAWSVGSGDMPYASAVTRQSLVINAVLGVFLSTLGALTARHVVVLMGAQDDTIDNAMVYFRIVSSGLVFQALSLGISAALRGAGETKLPMLYNLGSNLLNVLGNYVLIYGKFGFPRMEVAGAALSTTLSRVLACTVAVYVLFRRSRLSDTMRGSYRLNRSILRRIAAVGGPAALEQFVLQSGLILFARTVSGLGTNGFAAHQIGLNISGLSFSPSRAFGVAATTLVGQSLGAGELKKAQRYASIVHHMAIAVACLMGLVFLLFSHPLARLYTDDLEVAALAGTVLKILALAQPGQSTQLTLAGALRGAGDTMYPLYASIFGIWIFRVAVAFVFVNVLGWGLIGAWSALVLDQYTRALIVLLRFRSGKWKVSRRRNPSDDMAREA
jgi:putative MATE family efflux protein